MISAWIGIILGVVTAILATALVFTIRGNIRIQNEILIVETDKAHLERDIDTLREQIHGLEKELSFREGLQAGRKTDTLYRQLLKKYNR